MKKYFGLLSSVAEEYGIRKGKDETDDSWKARIVYSLLGQAGYASLFDVQDDLSPTSIVHFKKRISKLQQSLLAMYPEIKRLFATGEGKSVEDEIYSVFNDAGCLYHEPNRLTPSMRRISPGKNLALIRGQAVDEKRLISGLGSYILLSNVKGKDNCTIEEAYCLSHGKLKDQWARYISNAVFGVSLNEIDYDFLRLYPPYRYGYWQREPDTSGRVSIARTRLIEPKLYFLYKYSGNNLLMSQLPAWMTEGHQYRSIAVPCLADIGTLPETRYHEDGCVVTINIGYLYPPAELHLVKLYSWPSSFSGLPHDFNRTMSIEVFEELRFCLEQQGYCFKEE